MKPVYNITSFFWGVNFIEHHLIALLGVLVIIILGLVGIIFWPKSAKAPTSLQKGLADNKAVGDQLANSLSKTREGFVARTFGLLKRKQFDATLFEQLEEILFTADIGAKTSQLLLHRVQQQLSKEEITQGDRVLEALKIESRRLLEISSSPLELAAHQPFIILVVGVNGAGKTTSIGKLAAQFANEHQKVLLAAGDTFRAAAVEQLGVWAERTHSKIVKGKEGADPSAVIFDAIKQAQQEKFDLVIADTAGRLHVKTQLMEELQKIRRVIKKADPSAPHQTWLVLDATNGQNAIAQASVFKQALEVTGIILTKLDGTAKGGVILGIVNELQIPVRYIGIGEKVEDLRKFDADEFIEALFFNAEVG